MSETTEPQNFKRVEFLVITKNESLLSTAHQVAEFFGFREDSCSALETMDIETRQSGSPMMVLSSFEEISDPQQKVSRLQALRQMFPRSQIVVVLQGEESAEECEMLRNGGAQYLLLAAETQVSSKLYYLSALLVQGTYLPVPVLDLFPGTQLSFNAYHKLVLNQKFLPVIFAGLTFTDKKYRKLEASKQIYVRREDISEYRKYIETYHDKSGAALKKRCRSVMMNMLSLQSDISLILTLDTEAAKPELLKTKMAHFLTSAEELAGYLKECPDVWNVIHQSLDVQFCRYERGPIFLAYALCIAVKAEVGVLKDLAQTALLADLGILDLPPEAYKNWQQKGEASLTPQEMESFRNHPMASLNRAVVRQVEMSNEVRSSVVCTHEQEDLNGFPNQVPADKIPLEARLILFATILDQRVREGFENGQSHDVIRKRFWEEEKVSLARFSAEFLDKIEKVLAA